MGDAAIQATIAAARELMRERTEILEHMAPLQKSLDALQSRVDAIDDLIASLAAYQNAMKEPATRETPPKAPPRPQPEPVISAAVVEPKLGPAADGHAEVIRPWEIPQANGVSKRALTQKQAIAKVLQDADGPIHGSVLWERMQALGIRGGSSNPLNVLDNQILDMRKKHGAPIVNWGRRMYQWRGAMDEKNRAGMDT